MSLEQRVRLVSVAAEVATALSLTVHNEKYGRSYAYFGRVAPLFPPLPFDTLPAWLSDAINLGADVCASDRRREVYERVSNWLRVAVSLYQTVTSLAIVAVQAAMELQGDDRDDLWNL